ncbi:four helix bundle protein [Roseibacillus ishigakijimensis]|uniref:Four helix bundle protein n=1 Tax=Roseibacillus ishigakijimensis TaxID=454146 RepID=A0A934RNZ7_9BACT|nr:four helix bundle protein [Roseibacillus ishigakijimensis]MBK1832901.1 four helix bundle protein [Roseibacillus ishigakijimensis]
MVFSLRCLALYRALPRSQESKAFGVQMLRSSSSVGANHREACRARSQAEFLAKMGDCLKELDETSYWLELIRRGELMAAERLEGLEREADELIAIFVTVVNKNRRNS